MENRNLSRREEEALPAGMNRGFPRRRYTPEEELAFFGDELEWASDGSSAEEEPSSSVQRQRAYRQEAFNEYFYTCYRDQIAPRGQSVGAAAAAGQAERLRFQMQNQLQLLSDEEKMDLLDARPSCSSASDCNQVTVDVSGDPPESEIYGPSVAKKKQAVQPWMVGNVYSWPVGALFDHIEGVTTEEWMDEGCSSDDDDDDEDSEDEVDNAKGKGKKKAVDDILVEMGLPKVVRTRRQTPALPKLLPITATEGDIQEIIKLKIQDIVMQAVQKYTA